MSRTSAKSKYVSVRNVQREFSISKSIQTTEAIVIDRNEAGQIPFSQLNAVPATQTWTGPGHRLLEK
ncbi:hypothetical protein XI07_04995 [Bradyrhizobium sp. CCBAU 11445]|nr:hypothetical protein [Bradyrhizobium sp. CCBAU 11445]